MNHSLLNEALIEKNIAQIEFYTNEEFSSLGKFCDRYEEGANYYQSNNTNALLNHINKFRYDTNTILNKRMQYIKVLNDVLAMYRELTKETSEAFAEMTDGVDEEFAEMSKERNDAFEGVNTNE